MLSLCTIKKPEKKMVFSKLAVAAAFAAGVSADSFNPLHHLPTNTMAKTVTGRWGPPIVALLDAMPGCIVRSLHAIQPP